MTGEKVSKSLKAALHRWRPWLKRGALPAFFAVVASLLVLQARSMDGPEVLAALKGYPLRSLGLAGVLAAASLAPYNCFDLLGRHCTRHTLTTPTAMSVTFISDEFNLNLGSLMGRVAFRFQLSTSLGLAEGHITRILTLSLVTNWTGYLLVPGLVFSILPPTLPDDWPVNAFHHRSIGSVLVSVAAAYLALCALSAKRVFAMRGYTIPLPSAALGSASTCDGRDQLAAHVRHCFRVASAAYCFPVVVSVLMLAGIAGVITHIPAGLRVLEAVFVALFFSQLPTPAIMAALVAYRVICDVAPLRVAATAYVVMEARAKKLAVDTAPSAAGTAKT